VFEFSRRLAWIFGCALPVLETVRRFHQLGDIALWPAWFDDVILGAALLTGTILTSRGRYQNAKFLAAAWGITCGMGYGSFFATFQHLDVPDPAPLATSWVAAIKGVGFALAIVALIGALRPPPQAPGEQLRLHPERLEEELDASDDA
jgi:hypothetical protein